MWTVNKRSDSGKCKKCVTALEKTDFQFSVTSHSSFELLSPQIAYLPAVIRKRKDGIRLVYIPPVNSSYAESAQLLNGEIIYRNQIRQQLWQRFDQITDNRASEARRQKFKNFLKGKKKDPLATKRLGWRLDLGSLPMDVEEGGAYEIQFFRKKNLCAVLRFDNFPIRYVDKLPPYPEINCQNCSPINRPLYYYENGEPFIPKGIPVYKPNPRRSRTETFTLIFGKSQTRPVIGDLAEVEKFLRDSSYTIRQAKITAFASVEGQDSTNLRLQKERAGLLLKLLQKVNADSITPTIETAENWDLFFKQLQSDRLKNTPYGSWTNKTQSQIKELLKNEQHLKNLEVAFAAQRKAELKLMVEEKLTPEKIREIIREDFERYRTIAENPRASNEDVEKAQMRIAAIRRYVREEIRTGTMAESDEFCNSLFTFSSDLLNFVDFYDMLSDIQKQKPAVCYDEETIIRKNLKSAIDRVSYYYSRKNKDMLKAMLSHTLYLQSYVYKRISDRQLSPEIYCKMAYPFEPPFQTLLLNHIDFNMGNGAIFLSNTTCANSRGNNNNRPLGLNFVNGPFYEILKQVALSPEADETEMLFEFDLYRFLTLNVESWDEMRGVFFDTTFQAEDMVKQFERLEKIAKALPEENIRTLRVKLYLKLANYYIYGDRRDEYSARHTKALEALRTLHKFYKGKAYTSGECHGVAKHYIFLHQVMADREVLVMARDILLPAKESLNEEAQLEYYLLEVTLSRRPDGVLMRAASSMTDRAFCNLVNNVYHLASVDRNPKLREMIVGKCR